MATVRPVSKAATSRARRASAEFSRSDSNAAQEEVMRLQPSPASKPAMARRKKTPESGSARPSVQDRLREHWTKPQQADLLPVRISGVECANRTGGSASCNCNKGRSTEEASRRPTQAGALRACRESKPTRYAP